MNILIIVKKIFAAVLSLTLLITVSSGSVMTVLDKTPINATKHDYCYDNDRLLIGGYNYNLNHANETYISYVKEAGIDFLITSVNEGFLDLCDSYDIGVIAKNYNAPSFYAKTGDSNKWFAITKENYKNHECLWGDDLIDEPSTAAFEDLAKITDHYYANTDGKIPLINLFPSYANSKQLGVEPDHSPFPNELLDLMPMLVPEYDEYYNRYIKHVAEYISTIDTDIISVDFYPLEFIKAESGELEKSTYKQWLSNLAILAEACRDTGRDLWVITQAAGLVTADESEGGVRYCDTPEDIRWQMYTSLAFGTKAVIHACYDSGWWDTDSHLIDADGNRTDTYYAVKTVDEEVAEFADIYGDYTYTGTFLENSSQAAGARGGYISPSINSKTNTCKVWTNSPILVGCFDANEGDSHAYVVTNMTELGEEKDITAKLCFDDAKKITVYRKGVASIFNASSITLTLDSGEGVFIVAE